MRQIVSNPKLKWWQGVLLIIGIVALFIAVHLFGTLAALMYGGDTAYTVASVGYWVFGGAVALLLVRTFIMQYLYTIEGLTFRIDRVYSSLKPRMAATIVTRSIIDYGTVDDMDTAYPGCRHESFVRRRAPFEIKAVVYETDGGVRLAMIQPDADFDEKLKALAAENGGSKRKKK